MNKPSSRSDAEITHKEVNELIVKIAGYSQDRFKIAFGGFPGHGKSSLINTIASFLSTPAEVKQVAHAGTGDKDVTKAITRHSVDIGCPSNSRNCKPSWELVDTPGYLCHNAHHDNLMRGDRHGEELFIRHVIESLAMPLQRLNVYCYVAVINAAEIWNAALNKGLYALKKKQTALRIDESAEIFGQLQTIKRVRNILADHGIRFVCVLTKLDDVDPQFQTAQKLCKINQSIRVKRIRQYVTDVLGMIPNQVHAVVNMFNEYDPADNWELGRVALTAFSHCMRAAKDGKEEADRNRKADNIPAHGHIAAPSVSDTLRTY